MLKVQIINHLSATLFSHPSVFGPSDLRASMEVRKGEGEKEKERGEGGEGVWGEGWGWSFQGPKFSVRGEEEKLENNQHTQYAHFKQHRHMYAQLVRSLQVCSSLLMIYHIMLLFIILNYGSMMSNCIIND